MVLMGPTSYYIKSLIFGKKNCAPVQLKSSILPQLYYTILYQMQKLSEEKLLKKFLTIHDQAKAIQYEKYYQQLHIEICKFIVL